MELNENTFFDLWFVRLFLNILGYATIVIPSFIIVKCVKKYKLIERTEIKCLNHFFKIFVEGNDIGLSESSSNQKLVDYQTTFQAQCMSLIFFSSGLLGSYLIWGLLQERVMVYRYKQSENDIGELFENSQFIVFANRILAFIVAYIGLCIMKQGQTQAPLYKYLYCSISNILSSWCQYEALKFVSFPVQVLAKTSKIVPVMLMGKLMSQKTYKWIEYATAIMISFGIFLFVVTSKDSVQHKDKITTISGVIILICYLIFDSFTSNWQDRLFTLHSITSLQMMVGVNLFSVLLTSVSLLQQGGFSTALSFAIRHPIFAWHILILSLTSAIGQIFIFTTISRFGAATFTIIMTVRQGIAILLSCIVYDHPVTILGSIGVAIVFLGIFIKIYYNQRVKLRSKRDLIPTKIEIKKKPLPHLPVHNISFENIQINR